MFLSCAEGKRHRPGFLQAQHVGAHGASGVDELLGATTDGLELTLDGGVGGLNDLGLDHADPYDARSAALLGGCGEAVGGDIKVELFGQRFGLGGGWRNPGGSGEDDGRESRQLLRAVRVQQPGAGGAHRFGPGARSPWGAADGRRMGGLQQIQS